MKKEVKTDKAPAAIGPYSQAIRFGEMLFISGQIPLDASTAKVVGEDVASQTRKVMTNLEAVLTQEGLSFKDLVKTTIYVRDLKKFGELNAVYEEFLTEPYPARATIEVSALPKDVQVEIEAIACYP